MTILFSRSANSVVTVNKDGPVWAEHLLTERRLEWPQAQARLSCVSDWVSYEQSLDELRNDLVVECRTSLCVDYIQELLTGLGGELEERVFQQIETHFERGAKRELVMSRILLAPLREPNRPAEVARRATERGCAATAGVLDEVGRLQPHIGRIAARWSTLPASAFVGIEGGPSRIWQDFSHLGALYKIANADSVRAFRSGWNMGLVSKSHPADEVKRLATLGALLADTIFPSGTSAPERVREAPEEAENTDVETLRHHFSALTLSDVQKRIDAIVSEFARGRDLVGMRYLQQLRRLQQDDKDHAVKSLCNIASGCADHFRWDIEKTCLQQALDVAPSDAWALIQWGDHLKRTHRYEMALRAFSEAEKLGGNYIRAKSGQAEVYSRLHEFRKAENVYRSISGWDVNLSVRVALADVLRYSGKAGLAREEYEAVLSQAPQFERAINGLAELERADGNHSHALARINFILENLSLEPRVEASYRLKQIRLRKILGYLKEALSDSSELSRRLPFYAPARIERSSILGILGNTKDALAYLDAGKPSGFSDWRQGYVKGLLLLRTKRFERAVDSLDEAFDQRASERDLAMRRLGAALGFLHPNRPIVKRAVKHLSLVKRLEDQFESYVADVLRMHVASIQRDKRAVRRLAESLEGARSKNERMYYAVECIQANHIKDAWNMEVELLLGLA